jgi:F0F1-type ATP synthase membrane subunit b/b'
LSAARNEIDQLKADLTALREKMELLLAEHEDECQKMRQAANDEMNQLKQTIIKLRGQLKKNG